MHPLTEAPQLVLEARQLIQSGSGSIEVHRWRFIYDFSALAPAVAMTPIPSGYDRVELENYSLTSSPVILLAQGGKLAQRTTNVSVGKSFVDVDNMTQDTPNVEIAVWAYDNQPVLHLKPRLTAGSDSIPESAPGLLKLSPNLRLPTGKPAPDVEWKDLARCDYAVANHLFLSNRMGIELQFAISGAINSSGGTPCKQASVLRGMSEFSAKNLNLFYLAEDYAPQNCCLQDVPEAMFITIRATPTSLAHELGHSFGLWHDERSGNIMLGDALDRSEFTLPQVYLMMFGEESTLNLFGLRGLPTRNRRECPTHCRGGVSTEFIAPCVKTDATFSGAGSPTPMDEVHVLLKALNSEESIPGEAPFSKQGPLAGNPALVPFLKTVALKGVQYDSTADKIRAIRSLLSDQECAVGADTYVKLYSSRLVANSQRAAANALFALDTQQARVALKDVKQSVSGSLKKHIENLLKQQLKQ
jgi:hypothetical protein